MKLSTGQVAFPIEFDNGDKDCIYFNPNDPDLAIRLTDFQSRIAERLKQFDEMKIKDDGTPEDVEMVEDFRKLRNLLYEEIDIAFGGNISQIIFKHCSPLATVKGEYFIILFIKAIKPEIEKEIKKANSDVMKKMEKHIGKYKK